MYGFSGVLWGLYRLKEGFYEVQQAFCRLFGQRLLRDLEDFVEFSVGSSFCL